MTRATSVDPLDSLPCHLLHLQSPSGKRSPREMRAHQARGIAPPSTTSTCLRNPQRMRTRPLHTAERRGPSFCRMRSGCDWGQLRHGQLTDAQCDKGPGSEGLYKAATLGKSASMAAVTLHRHKRIRRCGVRGHPDRKATRRVNSKIPGVRRLYERRHSAADRLARQRRWQDNNGCHSTSMSAAGPTGDLLDRPDALC